MSEWLPITKLFNFEKGTLQSSKCTSGDFTFITAAEEWKTHDAYTHETEALIFAMAASGSLGRTHYVNGKFTASDLCFILTPKTNIKLDLAFYFRIFNFIREDIVKKTATGTSKLAINQSNFGNYKIPYFDYDHQLLFREKIDSISTIKNALTKSFSVQKNYLTKLRQSILQEAIEGKLTADWRVANPVCLGDPNTDATALLATVKAEKEKLVFEGIIKKEKLLTPINLNDVPFVLPDGWVWVKLVEIATKFDYGTSSKSLKKGKVPVLRMGNIQNSFIDWNSLVYADNYNEITKYSLVKFDLLFNRTNSKELVGKTALFDSDKQTIYAGYLVRFRMLGTISPFFTNYLMNSCFHREWCNKVKTDALGQSNINATKLKGFLFPLPPLAEQNAIVECVDRLLTHVTTLEHQVTERKSHAEQLMQAVLKEAFTA